VLCSLADARLIGTAFEQARKIVRRANTDELGDALTLNRWEAIQKLETLLKT
jgi:hypothetical protein